MYRTYICDDCGYSTEEIEGAYLCPKCHNKMRIAKFSGAYGGGDITRSNGKWLWYAIITVFGLPLLVIFLNVFGVIIYIVLMYLVRKDMNNKVRDNAIPVNDVPEVEHVHYCRDCGYKLNDEKFCPNCGEKVLK